MDVIVVRHAIAEEREVFAATGRPDEERPVTADGARRMARGARGLARVAGDIERIATSPLVRADQTARILAEALDDMPVVEAPALGNEHSAAALDAWLAAQDGVAAIAVVGHEPDLGTWVARALHGEGAAPMPLRKGGACRLRFADAPGPGGAELVWFLPPKVLRRLGRR